MPTRPSRLLKDLLVACLLTLIGLAIGLLLAAGEARARVADRAANKPCTAAVCRSPSSAEAATATYGRPQRHQVPHSMAR